MSYPVFYVPAGDVLPIMFSTFDGGTGASITMTGLAVTDIEIYKDGSVTQRSSDAGYTLLDTDGIDFDGLTGIHGFSIDTGDNTDASFYTVGAWFTVVVSAVTVDAQTVSFIAAQFRLMAAESVAAKPKVDVDAWLGTACATPTVAGVPEVDLTHVVGTTTNVAALATNVDAILTDTADMQPKLGAPAGASISADLLVIDNFVDGIEASLAAGVTVTTNNDKTGYSLTATTGLGNQTSNITGSVSGSVGSITSLAKLEAQMASWITGTAQAGAAGTITLAAGASAVTDFHKGSWLFITSGTGVGQGRKVTAYDGTTKVATISPNWATNPDATSVYYLVPEGLQIVDSSNPIAADVRQWIGTAVATPTTAGVPEVDVTYIGGDAQSATDLKDFADAGYDPATNKVQGVVLTDTVTTLTGNTAQTGDSFARIGATGSGLTSLASQASVTAVDDLVDTEIAAIKSDTAAILLDTNELQTDWANGGRLDLILDAASAPSAAAVADAVWDEVLSGHVGVGSAGEALAAAGTAGDPWTTAIPGAYGAGTAGKIIGDNLNATVSSRASQATLDDVDDLLDTEVAAIKAVADAILVDTAEIGAAGAGLTALATQVSVTAIDDLLDTEVAAIKADTAAILLDTGTDGVVVATASKTGYALSSAGVAAVWDYVTEGATTAVQMMRGMFAALVNKISGGGTTTVVFRDQADTKARITATVDADGNRSVVTTDLT